MNTFPVKIINSGYSECSPAWSTAVKISLPFFRIYYVQSGSAAVFLRKRRYDLFSGNVYLIPGHHPFTNECPKRMSVYWFHGLPMSPEADNIIRQVDRVESWKIDELDFYRDIFLNLDSMDISSLNPDLLKLQSLMTFLLAGLMARSEDGKIPGEISPTLKKSVEYMDANYLWNPSLQRIASQACLAPNYFHRIFTKAFGVTPHAYMERKRMILARDLLISTEKDLVAIADECGYENAFYFSKVFKKHFHTSPGKARKHVLIP